MVCKGICIRHKAQKPPGLSRYAMGQRRCQICEIFMIWDSSFCPCCGYRLRTKPRNMNYDVKLRISNKTNEARRNLVPLLASVHKKDSYRKASLYKMNGTIIEHSTIVDSLTLLRQTR